MNAEVRETADMSFGVKPRAASGLPAVSLSQRPLQARRHIVRRPLDRIGGEMGVPRRRLDLGVAEQRGQFAGQR